MTDPSRLLGGTPLTRRRALGLLGGLGLGAIAAACAGEGDSGAPAPQTSAPESGVEDVCVLTPELTEGPYYLDLDLVRRDITEGRAGTPLDLQVKVVGAGGCAPIENAAVDVWHCDADGTYSGVSGDDGTFLRGIQTTDAEGIAEFRTIYPGWYTGRAVHIHVKVSPDGSETFTGQLFFDDATTAAAYEAEPYAARGAPDTPNAADGIFGQGGSSTIVAVTSEGEGYSGAVILGLQRR
ncbi:MAG: intradiol ring-cleavage dioxygenase [Gemmatimonadota bacterium]